MACFNAIGQYMPPLIVFPGQRIRDVGLAGFEEVIYGHSTNGWMDSILFLTWLNELLMWLKKISIPLPVVLFVDGHSTHVTLEAAEFCSKNTIIRCCLVPNATHLIQPADVALFSPMKAEWKNQVKIWQLANLGEPSADKEELPPGI